MSSREAATPADAAVTIRNTVTELSGLESDTARYLNALAFVLMRVAEADDRITGDETERMETLLVEHAGLTPAQAVLVVEIARHRALLADCGCAYRESRQLGSTLDPMRRLRVLDYLMAVAEADGETCRSEQGEIIQIAAELGFSRDEVALPGSALDA